MFIANMVLHVLILICMWILPGWLVIVTHVIVAAAALSSEADAMFCIGLLFTYLFFLTRQRCERCTDLNQIFHNDVVGTSHEPHGVQSKLSSPKLERWVFTVRNCDISLQSAPNSCSGVWIRIVEDLCCDKEHF
jgi:hypothetical protein